MVKLFEDCFIPLGIEINPFNGLVRISTKGEVILTTNEYDEVLQMLKELFEEFPSQFKKDFKEEFKNAQVSN